METGEKMAPLARGMASLWVRMKQIAFPYSITPLLSSMQILENSLEEYVLGYRLIDLKIQWLKQDKSIFLPHVIFRVGK